MAERSKVEQTVYNLVEEVIAARELDLVDVEYIKEGREWYLRIFIDKNGGVTLEDCSGTSLAIDPLLDELDIFKNPYNLEVSSPGLDRPFVTDRDFERNINQLVEIHPTRIQKGGKAWFEGILQSVTQEELVIVLDEPFVKGVKPRTNGQEKSFSRQDVKLVKKAIRF